MVEKKSMMKKTTSKKSDVSEDDKVTKKSSKRTKKDDAELLTEEVEHQYDSQMAEQIVSDAVVIDNTGHTSSSISESDVTIEKKLESLFKLQVIDSKIDEIRIIRGELPLEVQDLEDEIVGLETRIENYESEIEVASATIAEQKIKIEIAQNKIKGYEEQKMNVRNNREYESLSKEAEYQGLEIQLSEKKIKEANAVIERLQGHISASTRDLLDKKDMLQTKKEELDGIILETENEEERLVEQSKACEQYIEERLLNAYYRIRKNVRNGLAVVQIDRDACAGCFNKIPPQRQLDIKMHKKIIVCEFCGRILVDDEMATRVKEDLNV